MIHLPELVSKRWVTMPFGILIGLFVIVLIGGAGLNQQGARELRAVKSSLVADHETLDFRSVVPAPVPDELNFCATPALKDIAAVIDGDVAKGEPAVRRNALSTFSLPMKGDRPDLNTGLLTGRPADLAAFAQWCRGETSLPMPAPSDSPGEDILTALASYDSLAAELSQAASRPFAQWTPAWKTRELPSLLLASISPQCKPIQHTVRMLHLRTIAAAQAGKAHQAHESLTSAIRLADACADDPFLISLLVGTTSLIPCAAATWEVCAAQTGTTAQFKELEAAWAHCDLKASALFAWRTEMCAIANAVEISKSPDGSSALDLLGISLSPKSAKIISFVGGNGLIDLNAANILRYYDSFMITPLRDHDFIAWSKAASALEEDLKSKNRWPLLSPGHLLARLSLPATIRVSDRVIYAQSLATLAAASCATERYRLERGAYPSNLDAAGTFFDPWTGQALGYEVTPDRRYKIWSFGPDGLDNRGTRAVSPDDPKTNNPGNRDYQGDIVWEYVHN